MRQNDIDPWFHGVSADLHGQRDAQPAYRGGVSKPAMMVTSVSISAPDPRALAGFYSRLLDWPVTVSEPGRPGYPPEDGWAQLKPPPGTPGTTLNFEYEADYVAPTWPSTAGQQQVQTHLDIAVQDLAAVPPGRWRPVRR